MSAVHSTGRAGRHPCKLPFCDKRFPTARALQMHRTADHAKFRFYPEDPTPQDVLAASAAAAAAAAAGGTGTAPASGMEVAHSTSAGPVVDEMSPEAAQNPDMVYAVVCTTLDLVIRRVEYENSSTVDRARMRCVAASMSACACVFEFGRRPRVECVVGRA